MKKAAAPRRPAPTKVFGQPSWQVQSDRVHACLTVRGGHLGPVTYDLGRQQVQPFAIAPWAEERLAPGTPDILKVLRGDFFCLPFGGNEAPFHGEQHPVHGETANRPWQLAGTSEADDCHTLHARLRTTIRKGQVDKYIHLIDGHQAVYCQHVVSGMSGAMNFGHHATLRFPDVAGCGRLSFSPFKFGQVYVRPTELPAAKGYSLLQPGAVFTKLNQVPTITGQLADLSTYPARRGWEDIAILMADPTLPFAWTAATVASERYVWFALKDPRVLAATLMWHSNGGRHYAPWNSRHVNTLGLEEITGFFHEGLASSAAHNSLSQLGFPTSVTLSPTTPLVVNYVMAMTAIPAGFDQVASIEVDGTRGVVLTAVSGKAVKVRLALDWLQAPAGG